MSRIYPCENILDLEEHTILQNVVVIMLVLLQNIKFDR